MRLVQNICCDNQSGFAMHFRIRWQDRDGEWHTTDWSSGDYAGGQARTSPDLVSIGVAADALAVRPRVHAVSGEDEDGDVILNYGANGVIAKYNVQGEPSSFEVALVD